MESGVGSGDVLGEASGSLHPEQHSLTTKVGLAALTTVAASAGGQWVDDDASAIGVDASDLVPHHEWWLPPAAAGDPVQLTAADTHGLDRNQHLIRARNWFVDVEKLHLVDAGEDQRAHGYLDRDWEALGFTATTVEH